MFYRKPLRKKISNCIKDLFENKLKSYSVLHDFESPKYWMKCYQRENQSEEKINQDRYKETDKILRKHKVKYVGEGVSRIGFEITHGKETFIFKVCFDSYFLDIMEKRSFKDENENEFKTISSISENIYVKSLILPIVDYFYDPYAKNVLVMPKLDYIGYDYKNDHRYTAKRKSIIELMNIDAHDGNVGLWKGLHWIFDFNSVVDDYEIKNTIKKHKRYISTSKVRGVKYRFEKAKKLIKEYGIKL